ncbi:hypothetical protein niasHT_003338 [Heterodera trifolii]|uniref:DNA-directed DNA polymerase n=1 Tax=Heterodera trifolii TaxID=157864 RepID=A0ABD2LY70_9BILA
MQKVVRTIGCQLFYTDTDSLGLSHPLDFCPLKTGQHLGEFTDEYPDHEILEFCSGGAKQYGLVLRRKNTSSDVELEYVLKVRGMTLNYDVINNQGLRYETFKQQVMRYVRTGEIEQIKVEYPNFLQPSIRSGGSVTSTQMQKCYRPYVGKGIFFALLLLYSSKAYRTPHELSAARQNLPHYYKSAQTFPVPLKLFALPLPYTSKTYRTFRTLLAVRQNLPYYYKSAQTFPNPLKFFALLLLYSSKAYRTPHELSAARQIYRTIPPHCTTLPIPQKFNHTQLTLVLQVLPHYSLTFNNPPIFAALQSPHNFSYSSKLYRTQLTLLQKDLPHSSLTFNNPPIFTALQSPHNFPYSSKLYRTQLTLLQKDLPHSSLTFINPPIFTALQSPHNFPYSSKLYRTQLTLLQQDLPHSSLTFINPPIFTALQSPHNFSYSSKLYRTQLTLLQQDLPHSSLTFNNPPIFPAHNSLSSNIYRIPFFYRQ